MPIYVLNYFILTITLFISNGASLWAADIYNLDSIKTSLYDVGNESNIVDYLPIGFSEDGHFSYATKLKNCKCENKKCVLQIYGGDYPCTKNAIIDITLINMINGQISHLAQGPEKYRGYDMVTISQFLSKYRIVQIQGLAIEQFPYAYNSNIYDIEIRKVKRLIGSSETDRVLPKEGLEFWIFSKDLGKKMFYFHEVSSEYIESGIEVGHKVVGLVKSPFENRAAVVIQYYQRMFEEEYNPSIVISGVQLSQKLE